MSYDTPLQRLESMVTGRRDSLFDIDLAPRLEQVRDSLTDARVLIIGAAGSIGGSFTREISRFEMRCLHLVDLSENNLAEVVRDLRSTNAPLPEDFSTFALDYSSNEMRQCLASMEGYDYVFNFAALKHVRSERDPFTLMRMLITNVLGNDWLMEWLGESPPRRFFCVSSDKAVRPANLMGASKAFMERVLLSRSDAMNVSSARFANVAYSDGSLLHGFNQRMARRQPLSAPSDIRRYFISHREAAQLCLLSAFIGNNREIFYPKMFSEQDALSFADLARQHLAEYGFEVVEFESDAEAVGFMASEPIYSKRWACHFSSSNTTGEKPCEEFSDPSEGVDEERLKSTGIVNAPIQQPRALVEDAINRITRLRNSSSWSKSDLLAILSEVVPELQHIESHRNLDQKM